MRVRVHAPDDPLLAAGFRARAEGLMADGGAILDRLMAEGPPGGLVLFTDDLAALSARDGRMELPLADCPVIEFLRALERWPRGPRMGAAVLATGGFDRIAAIAASAAEAELGVRVIGGTDAPLEMRASAEEIWDRLSDAVRRARTLLTQGRIHAAAIGLRGRGRIAGPVNPDLLIRFGVSAFR